MKSPRKASTPLVTATRGLLLRRRHLYSAAIEAFQVALDSPRLESRAQLRTLLHMADAQAKNGDPEGSGVSLKLAMEGLLSARDLILFSPDLQELADLVQHALLDPELSPYMEVLLDKFDVLMGRDSVPSDSVLHLKVQTMGRAAIFRDGEEIKFSLQGSVLTLAYLALHPGCTRRELETTLYPDREGKTAGDYFRAVFRELRVKLGQQILWMDGSPKAPRYRLGPGVHLDLDLEHLREALSKGDTARALSLYRGAFLPDSKLESEWVGHDPRGVTRRSGRRAEAETAAGTRQRRSAPRPAAGQPVPQDRPRRSRYARSAGGGGPAGGLAAGSGTLRRGPATSVELSLPSGRQNPGWGYPVIVEYFTNLPRAEANRTLGTAVNG